MITPLLNRLAVAGPASLRRFMFALVVTSPVFGWAAVQLASPFSDHMVLQRDITVPVWGTAEAGENITVEFDGQDHHTTAGSDGRWRVELTPLAASAESRSFVVKGSATPVAIELTDVLVGEVWLCGGQSNMERQLGLRSGQKPIVNWEQEGASANYPLIRQLYVSQKTAFAPLVSAEATWSVCSPATVPEFTAVGYFFARDLHARLGVPIGIIHSSWGGTPAEAWTSAGGLRDFPEFAPALTALQSVAADPAAAAQRHADELAEWYRKADPGSRAPMWNEPELDTADWVTMNVPIPWEEAGYAGFDGLVWFRKSFDLPATWAGEDVALHLGAIDDIDHTWVNGTLVGITGHWTTPRVYHVSGSALKPRNNVIAIRVLDTAGNGGLWNDQLKLQVVSSRAAFEPIPLAGAWQCRFAVALAPGNRPPMDVTKTAGVPTVLYNAMIAPLVPFAIRGAAFYQGEANADRPQQYQKLLPALIADWREQWNQGDFPFLFVQIAPYKGQPPEIREAQLIAWQNTSNTAMAVTIDCGDAEDIHPAYKQPVGARLALAARALAYGEELEYSGPLFAKARFDEGRAVLSFTHADGGLVAHNGALTGFTVAGSDGIFHPANAEIAGQEVIVSSLDISQPVAVRYGWANVASGNLFNRAGLPASPFRTDRP